MAREGQRPGADRDRLAADVELHGQAADLDDAPVGDTTADCGHARGEAGAQRVKVGQRKERLVRRRRRRRLAFAVLAVAFGDRGERRRDRVGRLRVRRARRGRCLAWRLVHDIHGRRDHAPDAPFRRELDLTAGHLDGQVAVRREATRAAQLRRRRVTQCLEARRGKLSAARELPGERQAVGGQGRPRSRAAARLAATARFAKLAEALGELLGFTLDADFAAMGRDLADGQADSEIDANLVDPRLDPWHPLRADAHIAKRPREEARAHAAHRHFELSPRRFPRDPTANDRTEREETRHDDGHDGSGADEDRPRRQSPYPRREGARHRDKTPPERGRRQSARRAKHRPHPNAWRRVADRIRQDYAPSRARSRAGARERSPSIVTRTRPRRCRRRPRGAPGSP